MRLWRAKLCYVRLVELLRSYRDPVFFMSFANVEQRGFELENLAVFEPDCFQGVQIEKEIAGCKSVAHVFKMLPSFRAVVIFANSQTG